MPGARDVSRPTKSERTRARILEAASQLILEHGGRDFQMSEVASRCDMSKGSLYYYFPDRDAIVEEIFTEVSDRFAARLEAVVAHSRSAEEAIRSLLACYCEAIHQDRLFVVAMAYELHNASPNVLPQLRERYEKIAHLAAIQIDRAKAEGLVSAETDSQAVADAICGAVLFGATRAAREQDATFDGQAEAQRLFNFIMHGVGA